MENQVLPTPKKQTRSCKLTKEQSHEKLMEITKSVWRHLGQPAILFVKDGRDMIPYYVTLLREGKHVQARYKCYDPHGKFRCYLSHCVNSGSLMTGEQRIVFFDEGI